VSILARGIANGEQRADRERSYRADLGVEIRHRVAAYHW
jgi:hypothetical protein